MDDVAIDENGIQCLLEHLDPIKAGGPDGLRGGFLKICAPFIAPFLKVLYLKSLSTGSLPHDWKVACVVPVYKSGPCELVNNYRPICLTSIACKILEHVLFSSVMAHITNQNLLNPRQHGFRRGLSCITQLTEFVHEVCSALDECSCVDSIFVDFRKAFDLVDHGLLVCKLR